MKLLRITFAITNMPEMVNFYDDVFSTNLSPFQPMDGITFYHGKLADTDILFCPNEIAQVNAEQNRQQFLFETSDITEIIELAIQRGGKVISPITEENGTTSAAISDPDGNTIEFVQKNR